MRGCVEITATNCSVQAHEKVTPYDEITPNLVKIAKSKRKLYKEYVEECISLCENSSNNIPSSCTCFKAPPQLNWSTVGPNIPECVKSVWVLAVGNHTWWPRSKFVKTMLNVWSCARVYELVSV